jgi:selenocysteine-specific elongation factor
VDHPGHASLIRHVLGGAQIVDFVLLVIDAAKGMQAQTWECLVIAELLTDKLVRWAVTDFLFFGLVI